jgi:two-component system KDP operon response regulator KdpE
MTTASSRLSLGWRRDLNGFSMPAQVAQSDTVTMDRRPNVRVPRSVSSRSPLFADSILIIEDDPQIRGIVATALRDTARSIHGTARATEGLAVAQAEQPDLVVLDLGLPDMAGVEVCRKLRELTRAPVIVLSARSSESDKVQLLNAGADDYVTKPFSVAEFVARVQAQLRRAQLYLSEAPQVIQAGDLTIDLARRTAARGERRVRLTPVEWNLLRALAIQAGRTLTHRQLFHAVWGNTFGDAQLHLRVHITHLRRKIELDPAQPSLIVTEPGVGYRCELVNR